MDRRLATSAGRHGAATSRRPTLVVLALTVAALVATGCVSSVSGNGSCGDAACLCASDSQCSGATPRCDRNSGTCVPCLPVDDNCPRGQRCIASQGSFVCATGCLGDLDCPRPSPDAAMTCCGGACLALASDSSNCGACGRSCPAPANATAACAGGSCTRGTCKPGFLDCDGKPETGCEVDSASSVQHCGSCTTVCTPAANQSMACVAGSCQATCNAGFAHCSDRPADGCEVRIDSDVRNCGGCGKSCPPLTHATSTCSGGACVVAECVAGFGDCNRAPQDGCETELGSDPANCGGCGMACPPLGNAAVTCQAAVCTLGACNRNFADCDGMPANGCETPIDSDPKNCGQCQHACGGFKSVQGCRLGLCLIDSCERGFADCDGRAENGCEAALATDVESCGSCARTCPVVANGARSCSNAQCGIGACNAGFGDCNKDPGDGCESDLGSIQSCGKCGVVCAAPANASAGCGGGQCGIGACNALWGDCDKSAMNGCEQNLASDVNNCGACGAACRLANAQIACLGGRCGILQCNAGFADCDMNANNGCELPVGGDPKNCGACGNACPQNTPYCASSVCVASLHSLAQLAPDFNTSNNQNCGDSSNWWSQNFGAMTYDQCETLANRYGAQYMGETGFFSNYAAPYQYTTRWVGEADATNGWLGTGSWNVINLAPKNQQQLCVLAYANASVPGKSTFNTTMTSANGSTYQVQDYGVIAEKACYTNALAAGARPLNPYLFANATKGTAHMVENHQNHGSAEYTGLSTYTVDGNCNHTYRCLVGYNNF